VKIAVCFSGQIRTGVPASANILNYIGPLEPYCTFFCHTRDINTRKPLNASGIARGDYPLIDSTLNEFCSIYGIDSIRLLKENYYNLAVFNKQHSIVWNPMYYSWLKSVELALAYDTNSPINFDFVIKLRPDLLLDPARSLSLEIAKCLLIDSADSFFAQNDAAGSNGWIDDIIYFARLPTMLRAAKFSTAMAQNKATGLNDHLITNRIKLASIARNLNNPRYCIYREESLHRDPVGDFELCCQDNVDFYNPL
jgi:hypothetical protein